MGGLCSSIDKDCNNPSESEAAAHMNILSQSSRRLRKMPLVEKVETTSHHDWRTAIDGSDFTSLTAYKKALADIQLAEKKRSYDAELIARSSPVEARAANLLQKIRAFDRDSIYGRASGDEGHETGKRAQGEHFLGSVDLIDKTLLMKVTRKMPKGAHLHIHFNSCLPARFLIRQARDIDAMYIRSDVPLTSAQNMAQSRISFMVMTPEEARHVKHKSGFEEYVPLGNTWEEHYIPNRWMRYQDFQRHYHSPDGTIYDLDSERVEAAEAWLEGKMQISEEEAHHHCQTGRGIWEKFNHRTQMMKGLFAYESAFRNYTKACIRDFVNDNIQYAEIRPNFMSTNSLKTDDGTGSIGNEGIMRIINEGLQETMEELRREGRYFGGMKVIYCTPRSFSKEQISVALEECIDLKKKYRDLLCGFDLVGHEEMGNELRHFVPEFLTFRNACKAQDLDIPFLFHCGETLDVGGVVDGNLFDAVLLNAKRIGHGYSIARHPMLMEIFRERQIAIESCPISNEVLGLTPVIAGHHLPILLANNVPCTINSDNATFYKSSLSHDFYQVMIGSESMSLQGWKQLALWSLEHSCMTPEERAIVTAEWSRRWDEFCRWIIDEYGALLEDWEPKSSRL